MVKDRMSAEEYLEMTGSMPGEPVKKRAKGRSEREEFNEGCGPFMHPEFQKELEKRRICELIEKYAPLCLEHSSERDQTEPYRVSRAANMAHALAMAVIERCNKL